MSMHVKIKTIGWDEQMVEKIHNYGDTQIAQDLLENGANFMTLMEKEEEDMKS